MGVVPLIRDKMTDIADSNVPDLISNGLPSDGSHTYRDAYKKAADASTGASTAGMLVNPANLAGGGLVANMGNVALQSGV